MIDHVSITVKDLDKSFEFYTTVFGLKMVGEWKRENEGLKAKILGIENKGKLELIESKHVEFIPKTNENNFANIISHQGFTHISFAVTEINSTISALQKLGGKVLDGPKVGITVKQFAFVQDINGIIIELVEYR